MTLTIRFHLTWRQVLPPLAMVLTLLLMTAFVTSSRAATAAGNPAGHTFEKSGAACAWAEKNKAKISANLLCPDIPSTNLSGQNANNPSPTVNPNQDGDGRSPRIVFGQNVDATNPNEDFASGQSETAIAASGRYVVSAWNDVTGFLAADSTAPEASGTAVGFSSDGGKAFQDINLPNNNGCQTISGDPGVVTYTANGTTYFYVTSLYLPFFGTTCTSSGDFQISLSVGTVSGNSISFGNPIAVADGGNVFSFPNDFLDKDFATVDPVNGKIAISYTAFGFTSNVDASGQINIALCDISSTPATPTCSPGTGGIGYLAIANSPSNFEELEGSYPAFSSAGNLYVVWNQNWNTNLFDGDPVTHQLAAWVPAGCLTLPTTSCSTPKAVTIAASVKSLDATLIPGYSRGIGNDFPRIAFNNTTNQVVFVWNEANAHPLGDIVMASASWDLSTVNSKVRVNNDDSFALHFLPAVSVGSNGNINVSWYDRRNAAGSTRTDVFAVSIKPGTTGGVNSKVTDVATDWLATGSLINPNFGDYTDNTTDGTTFYVNLSDGRIGIPNSFVASASTHS